MRKLAVEALSFKYKAEMADAKFTLENYLNNPAAIGEHPQLLEEMDNALEKWTAAQDKYEALRYLTHGDNNGLKEEPTLFEIMD